MRRALIVLIVLAVATPLLAQATTPEFPKAKEAVVSFLDLSDAQVAQWDTLWATRESTMKGLRDQVQGIEEQLKQLLKGAAPDPAAVGALVIQAKGLRDQVAEAEKTYARSFDALLTGEQKAKLAFIRRAEAVQPLLPAFRVYGLLPPLAPAS